MPTRYDNGLTRFPCPVHDSHEADGACNCRSRANQLPPHVEARRVAELTYMVVQKARTIGRGCTCDGEERCLNCDRILEMKSLLAALDKDRQGRSLLVLLKTGSGRLKEATKSKLMEEIRRWKKKYGAALGAVEKLHDILTRREK